MGIKKKTFRFMYRKIMFMLQNTLLHGRSPFTLVQGKLYRFQELFRAQR